MVKGIGERGVVLLPVAILTENRGVGGTEYCGWGIIACVAEQRTRVLGEELVGRVNLAVARETEFGRISSAVENRRGVATVVAGSRWFGRFSGHGCDGDEFCE